MTPRNMSMGIIGSVGRGGRNSHQDVMTIQQLLNEHIKMPTPKLVVDGKCGRKTTEAILHFQRSAVGLARPDGRVDPNGKTIAKLNDPSAILNYTPAPLPTHPAAGGGSGLKFKDEMKDEFKKRGGNQMDWDTFIKAFEGGSIPEMKKFLGSIGRIEDARSLVRFYLQLKKWGLTGQEMKLVFEKVVKLQTPQALKLFETASAPAGKFGSAIGKIGQGAARVGLVVTAIECAIHASRGDYSVIPAEIYKFVVGKAVPWAGILEGVQSLIEAVAPNTVKSDKLFKILRVADPIGLGASAVDSVYAVALATFDIVASGKLSLDAATPRLTRLVARMKQGPTTIFAEMGEDLGDALYELYTGPDIDWNLLARYSWSEIKGFFSGS